MVKRLLLAAVFALIGPRWAFAGDIVTSNFGGGLDTLDTPAELDPSMAQDLLNVQFQPGGGSVFKRDGYGLFQSLPVACSTCAIHGGYHFQQVGGNDVQLWGNDVELAASVNDATFVKIATGTVGATWQCADSQGFAYCLDSSRDSPVKTDGSAANTSYQTGIPLGTMLAFTPTQLAVAGVSGNENTIYVSQQNNFITFTIGVLPSSAFTEPIASPGSRITHLAYYFGKLFWWKDQSFGYATFTNQNDWQLTIVSNQIGTLDNSDAFWNSSGFDSGAKFTGTAQANAGQSPGGIFFRGQDNHFYVYDGYYLTRISRPITPTVTSSNRRKSNSWTQSSQADFQAGAVAPLTALSLTLSPGDIVPTLNTQLESSGAQWNLGTNSNLVIGASSITLALNNSGTVTNPDFESSFSGNWTASGNASFQFARSASQGTGSCTMSPQSGSFLASNAVGLTSFVAGIEATDLSGNVLQTTTLNNIGDCTMRQVTFTPSLANTGKRVKFRFHDVSSGVGDEYLTTSDSYIWGGSLTFYYAIASGASNTFMAVDDVQGGSSTITTGSFTSQAYNSGYSSATYQINTFNYTSNTSVPTIDLQTSTDSVHWSELFTGTSTSALGNKYFRYTSTISVNSSDSALTFLRSIGIIYESSGSYYSAVDNAAALTSWGNFVANDALNGNSTISYFIRSSTSSFSLSSPTPAWVPQTKNATVAASTGTFFQLRADFAVTAASETPTLSDFTFNWFEGSASDKAYIAYFNDAVWFSVSANSNSSSNNRIFYWDILNGAWGVYDIAANGFQIENNALYFGDPVQGRIYKYGSVTTDNGLPINSYWRSKSFYAPSTINPYSPPSFEDAFTQKSFEQADFILGESSTTLAYTYTLDSKTATTFNFTAYDPAASLIQRNFPLPPGKIGKYYDFKIGDNSSAQAWRMMGHRVHYNAEAWRPVLK